MCRTRPRQVPPGVQHPLPEVSSGSTLSTVAALKRNASTKAQKMDAVARAKCMRLRGSMRPAPGDRLGWQACRDTARRGVARLAAHSPNATHNQEN